MEWRRLRSTGVQGNKITEATTYKVETAATQQRQNQIGVARVGKADREKRYHPL